MKVAITRSLRATRILVAGLRSAVPALFGLPAIVFVIAFCVIGIGLPALPEAVRLQRVLTRSERRRAAAELGKEIRSPYRPARGTWWRQTVTILRDPASWRDLLWQIVHGSTGLFAGLFAAALWPGLLFTISLPAWWWAVPRGSVSAFIPLTDWTRALTLPIAQTIFELGLLLWLVPLMARGQLWLAETLLGPDRAELVERVEQLTESRTEALEAHGAELRRIERDLHDGVQAQLVSVAVRLGLAERAFTGEPDTALRLLQDARDGIEDTLGQLRGVIRGIYPPILSDRGLGGAVRALVGGQRVPVAVHMPADLPRAPAAVEAAAYFVVAESLTNVSKHSTADRVELTIGSDGETLRIMVRDNGEGGADPAQGSGLVGIQRRVAALDGRTSIASPAGQGTTIEVELPCGA
ncbi:MAG TPA: sensor domain-containing protein [Pseudonocardiaceae bacterium]|nr:sensor domain-containing protein [Pseudonocardiaceae bacterium]